MAIGQRQRERIDARGASVAQDVGARSQGGASGVHIVDQQQVQPATGWRCRKRILDISLTFGGIQPDL